MDNNKICSKCNFDNYLAKGLCGKCYNKKYFQLSKNKKKLIKYNYKNRKKIKNYMKNYYNKNKENILKKTKDYYQKNKEKIKNYNQQLKIKERLKKYNKEYFLKNKEKLKLKYKGYDKRRREKDINYRLLTLLRSRLSGSIKYRKTIKKQSTMNLLGCSIDFFCKYLEKQFKERMNWQNMGKSSWVIDHIKPCCSFDLTKLEEQKKCFHYTNLRPLWWNDNQEKAIEDKKKSIKINIYKY